MSASGDKAAVAYLASVAAMLLIAVVALSATNQAWRDQNPDQQPKTTAGYCDAKLGAIGYKKSPDKEPEPDSEEQKRRYDVCLQIRSAEAAERSAETGDNQYLVGIVTMLLARLATIFAGLAARYTAKQADAAHAALIADDRAWVKIDLRICQRLRIAQSGVDTAVAYTLKDGYSAGTGRQWDRRPYGIRAPPRAQA